MKYTFTMKKQIIKSISILILMFLASSKILADTNYVSKIGGHVSPFDSWVNAATNAEWGPEWGRIWGVKNRPFFAI